MQTAKQMWEEYRRVIPPNAPTIQLIETRQAFYAGILSSLDTLRLMVEEKKSEDEAVEVLDALYTEVVGTMAAWVADGKPQ